MAWLKDTTILGGLRVTDNISTTSLHVDKLYAADSSSGTVANSLGQNEQVLKSNGSKVYWGTAATQYTLPTAADGTLGGVMIGYTPPSNTKNYPVQLDNKKMYVQVPWTDTTYSFSNKNKTLEWGASNTIATVGGTNITVTMPSNPNTDHMVTQSSTTNENWRKILLHKSTTEASNAAVSQVTDVVYSAADISAQPSTGTLRANIYNIADKAQLQWNSTDQSIDFVFI